MSNPDWTVDHAKEAAEQLEHKVEDAAGSHPFELQPGDSNQNSNDGPHPFEQVADQVAQQAKDAQDQLKHAAEEASQKIEDKAKEATNALNQAAEEASNQAQSTLEKVEQKVESVVASVKESDLAKKLENVAEEACASVEHTVESAKSKILSTIGDENHPQTEEPKEAEAASSQNNSNLVRNIGICAVGAVAVFLIARFISKRRK